MTNRRIPTILRVVLTALPLLAARSAGGDVLKSYAGHVIVSAEVIPEPQAPDFESFLKNAFRKDGDYAVAQDKSGGWSVEVVGVTKQDPGGKGLSLVFYDRENKESQKAAAPVAAIDVATKSGQRILIVRGLRLDEESGFSPGKHYLVRFARLVNGKEVALASATLRLDPPKK